MAQEVILTLEVKDEDGTPFAKQVTTYYGVPREGVHLIEEEVLKMQSNLLDVAKEVGTSKAAV